VARFWTRLTERAQQLPGVQAVGLTGRLPLEQQGMNQNPMWIEGDATSTKVPPLQLYSRTDGGYFKAMGIPLLAGETFDQIERQRGDAAIISQETATRFFHDSTGRTALGKRFRSTSNGPWRTIIGVVGSTRDTSLAAAPTPVIYLPQAVNHDSIEGRTSRVQALVVRTTEGGDVAATTRAVQRLIREIDATLPPFDVRSMRATVSASIARLSFVTVVIGVAAAVTLVLGVVGLYGVIAYIVTLRTRELGVRIALGAEPRSVAAMVTRQALVLCGAGVVAGLALVVVVARFLRSFLFEVAPTDPATLAGAAATLVACALLSSWIPARRAARVNPIEALRAD
jgi:predicted permease